MRISELVMRKKVSNALFFSSTFCSVLAPPPSSPLNANETSSLDIIGHGPRIDGFGFAAGQARACAFVPEWKQGFPIPVLSPCSSPSMYQFISTQSESRLQAEGQKNTKVPIGDRRTIRD
ncbi:hypothetical protein F5H01DRAFT_316220 [Linnemannia elongata]|nr:hypothetical protein F5H01DRAFT_316220 [Linnemannia elongata]